MDPATTRFKDTHHPVCHDEAMSLRIAGVQVKGLVIDGDKTPTWDDKVVNAMLEWCSTFFGFEEAAILSKHPSPGPAAASSQSEAYAENLPQENPTPEAALPASSSLAMMGRSQKDG